MSYFGHTCELPFMERPMGPCPACEYAREMRDIAENAVKLKDAVKYARPAALPEQGEEAPRVDADAKTLSVNEANQMIAYAFAKAGVECVSSAELASLRTLRDAAEGLIGIGAQFALALDALDELARLSVPETRGARSETAALGEALKEMVEEAQRVGAQDLTVFLPSGHGEDATPFRAFIGHPSRLDESARTRALAELLASSSGSTGT